MSQATRLRMSASEEYEDEGPDERAERDEWRRERDAYADGEIPRRETVYRIGFTVLFALVASVVRTVLGLIVLFELIATLITRRAPGARVRELANRITTYYYRVLRYLTYNESRVPFPFSDFPDSLEPDAFSVEDRDSDALDSEPSERETR